jgi:hypothetical protein
MTKVDIESGTLILIGATQNEITLASDSGASSKYEGIQSGHTKIFPLGRYSACALFRQSAFTIRRGDAVLDRVDFADEITSWIATHPNLESTEAAPALAEAIRSALADFSTRNSQYSLESDTSVVCVGFVNSIPTLTLTNIAVAGRDKAISVKPTTFPMPPGFFVGLGLPAVTDEILRGTDSRFAGYRSEAAVQKFQNAGKNSIGLPTAEDLITLSEICLAATESTVGHVFDPYSEIVVPPNHFAEISKAAGFRNIPA